MSRPEDKSAAATPSNPGIAFLSTDGIKHVFDTVRNFVIVALVGFGASVLDARSESIASAIGRTLLVAASWATYAIAAVLILLNVIFFLEFYYKTSFHIKRQQTSSFWSYAIMIFILIIGVVIMAASLIERLVPKD